MPNVIGCCGVIPELVGVSPFCHPGLDPGSRFFFRNTDKEARPRVKPGVTISR
jgi:hypothetical protein